jgi:uncharacterized membrane protein
VVTLGEEATVTLGVVNHEQAATGYNIGVIIGGKTLAEAATGILGNGEGWEQTVSFTPVEVGRQQVEFWLYKGDKNSPSQLLRLWIDVVRD